MGVPTSEVGYTSAMPRREDHEVRKGHVGHWLIENNIPDAVLIQFDRLMMSTELLETCKGL